MESGPPSGFVAVTVELAVMEATDRDRKLVADLATKRSRLGESKVMRLSRRATTDEAGLPRYELAMVFVA